MVIVALSAWKRSGKDMTADYLVEVYGFKRVSFADPLKDEVANKFNIPRAHLDLNEFKEAPILTMPVSPKDTFSRMIAEHLFKEFRSADGTVPQDFGYENNKFVGVSGRDMFELFWTPRALAILEGSTKRSVDPDYWVKKAVQQMAPNGRYVISDLRYTNELSSLSKFAPNSVIPVRIERHESSPSTDSSERDLDNYPFPFVINNKGDTTKHQVFDQMTNILIRKEVF